MHSNIFDALDNKGVIPALNPTVPNADTDSNIKSIDAMPFLASKVSNIVIEVNTTIIDNAVIQIAL